MLEGLKEFLRRTGPHREEYLRSIMPKDPMGQVKWLLIGGARDIWTFPPAPCTWLCKRHFRRFHFTCLTCWTRRRHYKKRGWEQLKQVKEVYMMNKPPCGNKGAIPIQKMNMSSNDQIVVPIYYTNYGIFIPTDRNGAVNRFRLFIVKYLLTLAERIAEF